MSFERVNSGPTVLSSFSLDQGDPTTWLPEGAADRLRALRQRSSDLHRILPEFEASVKPTRSGSQPSSG